MTPGVCRLVDDVWVVPVPLPGGGPPSHTNALLLRDANGDAHVIDPGWDFEAGWAALLAGFAAAGLSPERVRTVTATHLHGDHLGLAGRLRDVSGCRVLVHRREQQALDEQSRGAWGDAEIAAQLAAWGVPDAVAAELVALGLAPAHAAFTADVLLEDDEVLPVAGRELRVMWTPGHTTGSICLRDDVRRVVLTGDTVLPGMNPGVGIGGTSATNPLADYLASLDRLGALDGYAGVPGHGPRMSDVAVRAREHATHHRVRLTEAAAVREAHPDATVWELASRLGWSGGWAALRGHQLSAALRQAAYIDGLLSGSH